MWLWFKWALADVGLSDLNGHFSEFAIRSVFESMFYSCRHFIMRFLLAFLLAFLLEKVNNNNNCSGDDNNNFSMEFVLNYGQSPT